MALPRVAAPGRQRTATRPAEADIDAVYEVFTPDERRASSASYAPADPRRRRDRRGAARARPQDRLDHRLYARHHGRPAAAGRRARATRPTTSCAPATSPAGRPTPLMMYRCFADLGVWPAWSVVKVDDTEAGIAEGKAAGSWTVGGRGLGQCVRAYRRTNIAACPAERETPARRAARCGAAPRPAPTT